MGIARVDFYLNQPKLGVPYSSSVQNIRSNSVALGALVKAAFQDLDTTVDGSHALAGTAYGELSNELRYRLFFDKDTDDFKIQYNDGTLNSPSWSNIICIRASDGRVSVVSTGGLESTSFYNFNNTGGFYLVVRESVGDKYVFDQGEAGLVFDSTFFYLTPVYNSNEVHVNLTPASSGDNTASSLGGDTDVFKQKSGIDLQFRGLTAGSNVSLVENTNDITISASADPSFYGINVGETDDSPSYPNIDNLKFNSDSFYVTQQDTDTAIVNFRGSASSGETNTASNLSGDEGIFAQKSGVDLQFKSLTAGTNVTLSSDSNTITINSTASGSGGSGFYGINVGETDDSPSFKGINGLKFNSNSFYVTQQDTDTAIINYRGDVEAEINTASNLSGDEGVFSSKVGSDLQFKSLTAGTNVTLSSDSNQITINSTATSGGGFYGVIFRESEPNGTIERDDTLVFDSTYFYLSSSTDGKPLLSFRPGISYVQEFTSSVSVQVDHNLGTSNLFWAVYDDADEALIPEKVDTSDLNTTYFYFSETTTGRALLTTGNASSAGEANTASNLGAGEGVFSSKSNTDLRFKSLVAGTNITISSDSDEITINSTASGSGGSGSSYTETFASSVEWTVAHNLSSNNIVFNIYDSEDRYIIPSTVDVSDPNTTYFYFTSAQAGKAVIFSDGLSAESGFYLQVAQSSGEEFISSDEKVRLTFNRNDFYLSNTSNTTEVLVNLDERIPKKYTKIFTSAVLEWQVDHSLNTPDIVFNTYDDRNQFIIPSKADVSDENTAYFYFASEQKGRAIIIG